MISTNTNTNTIFTEAAIAWDGKGVENFIDNKTRGFPS